ncbi:hypothetical protein BVI434_550048 [Burkholderia vietnamiensis]|nr:hypothetical protein BVI434_550048 [Burkholderia vietnamiensis]
MCNHSGRKLGNSHSRDAARKLLNSNRCEQTACATGYAHANALIFLHKPALSTELCVPC